MGTRKTPKVCTFEGCDKRHLAKGYCHGHYTQYNRGWELKPLGARKAPKPQRYCSLDGCERVHGAKGYCDKHYRQFKKGKPFTFDTDVKPSCAFETCERVAVCKGYCQGHYSQVKAGKELTPINYSENKARYVFCATCGTKFKRRNPRVKFCSRQCSAKTQLSPLRKAVESGDSEGVIKFAKEGSEVDDNGCWVWQGKVLGCYPATSARSGDKFIHRHVLEAKIGHLLGSDEAHHTCANRLCVNPEHLQQISKRENIAEMRQRKFFVTRIRELEDALYAHDPDNPLLDARRVEGTLPGAA